MTQVSVKVRSGLHALVRELASTPVERHVLAMTIVHLVRSRRHLLACAGNRLLDLSMGNKALLWGALAAALRAPCHSLGAERQQRLKHALRATHAYSAAEGSLRYRRSSPSCRGLLYRSLLPRLRQQRPTRVLVFHHYDTRGALPCTWLEALLAIRAAGWSVLVSTSDLESQSVHQLEDAGVFVVSRQNIGLCLGAYKDLSLLLFSDPLLAAGVASLVLCNDSNLPLQAPTALLSQLQAWTDTEEASAEPVLAGLTDSAQRACYHLQSFFLYANRALLQHPAWLRFWLGFSLDGTKDDLINRGEIGLSQAMLAAGVQLRPAYPLVQGLLADPAMAEELQRYGIWQPRHVNQSLFAWQSLLARGFPLVKKHVLFELIENQGLPMAIAELARWIPEERHELLAADLQQLFVSRYCGGEPEM